MPDDDTLSFPNERETFPNDAAAVPAVARREAGAAETASANRGWWDAEAADYLAEHGEFLGDVDFVWGPEGWREDELGLLGDVRGLRVLEFGCGAGQCGRWLVAQGAAVVGLDLAHGMLLAGRTLDVRSRVTLPTVEADAVALPFADEAFDLVVSSYGAVPFVADSQRLMQEAARVLRPGGRLLFATTHPFRWALPDDGGEGGLVVRHSYWDRTPYVEQDDDGVATYVEHHRTMGDRVREIIAAGLELHDVVEPTWPERNSQVWGGWSPTRGRLIPGTAIFVAAKPRSPRATSRS
ncbi:MAG: class I SAM-dependent methyltransferase [Actinomycetales bacterium]